MHLMCSLRKMSTDCHSRNGTMTAQIATLYLFANQLTTLYGKQYLLEGNRLIENREMKGCRLHTSEQDVRESFRTDLSHEMH